MNIRQLAGAVAFAAAMTTTFSASAQPATKLTGNLSDATIKAIWCSAMFLEESYFWDEGSGDALHYEDMAYDLGDALDVVMGDAGLPHAESEEIWVIFDGAAAEYAMTDEDAFIVELAACEEAYLADKLKLF